MFLPFFLTNSKHELREKYYQIRDKNCEVKNEKFLNDAEKVIVKVLKTHPKVRSYSIKLKFLTLY